MRTNMLTYVAMVRGINVGGYNKIKMADLRRTFERLGLERVKTYIQSGNVLFHSVDAEDVLKHRIEEAIRIDFGIQVTVVLRRSEELGRLVEVCPFTEEEVAAAKAAAQVECLYVALLPDRPTQESIERFKHGTTGGGGDGDAFHVVDRDIYLLFRKGIRDSKLANQLQKLDMPLTMRNWNTVRKLAEMARDMAQAMATDLRG